MSRWERLKAWLAQWFRQRFEGNGVRRLPPAEAYRLLQERRRDPDFVVLDVRTRWEYRQAHLPRARQLDCYARDFRKRLEGLDRTKVYLVYCRTGRRSARVAALMRRLGFQEVYDLRGGIVAWARARLPLQRGR